MASKLQALTKEARWRGFWGTIRALKMHKMGKMDCFVGEDTLKNRFFEDKTLTYGRHRWVEYVDGSTPDSLKITPDWHAWLHHNIDVPPSQQPLPEPTYKKEASGNPTGTADAYVPPHHRLNSKFHGGAGEKYESWKPKSMSSTSPAEGDVLDLK